MPDRKIFGDAISWRTLPTNARANLFQAESFDDRLSNTKRTMTRKAMTRSHRTGHRIERRLNSLGPLWKAAIANEAPANRISPPRPSKRSKEEAAKMLAKGKRYQRA